MLRPHRGPVILAFGILGFLLCQLFGVAAWVMADNDLREMERGYMDPSGRDLTKTGRILGMVSSALLAVSVIVLLCFILFAGLAHR